MCMQRKNLDLRSCHPDLLVHVALVQGKGALEHDSQLANFLVESSFVSPGQRGVEEFTGNTLERSGYLEAESAEVLVLGLGEFTRVNSVDDATGILKGAALACTKLAAGPASVDQPAVNVVLGHALGKHVSVATGVEDNERSAIAGREGWDRLQNTILSPWGFRGVTGQEVVAGLLWRQFADGWQDTESIAGQHDDIGGLAINHARNLSIGNVLDGICATSVFSDADIVVVGASGGWVVDDVLEDAAELDSVENIRLLFSGKVDALGVASTLDVEDTRV